MLKFKEGVILDGLAPVMALATLQVAQEFAFYDLHAVITSGRDGKHREGSLHYKGLALDFRTRHVRTEHRADLAQRIRTRLGPEFTVILEPDHLHIEFPAIDRLPSSDE